MVDCPVCGKPVREREINAHLDSGCVEFVEQPANEFKSTQNVATFFSTPAKRPAANGSAARDEVNKVPGFMPLSTGNKETDSSTAGAPNGLKRGLDDEPASPEAHGHAAKRSKTSNLQKAAPLADRMRPHTLDDVCGQELVGPQGVLRALVDQDRVPSMVLWGGPGTGKTTIARLVAHASNARFVEINSTSTGVGECKKLFAQAMNELQLTGRKTIIFCDEIHRFSKSQQDVFLGPVEAGLVTLIGATTENPSFKVISALLSRCRVFTLSQLADEDIINIIKRALAIEFPDSSSSSIPQLLSGPDGDDLISYLAVSSSGDARTALNLLELAISLSTKPQMTLESIKTSLTHTLIYDRQGDAHYDTISALHKSLRGSDPDAALYYLARMLASGEDPLYIARRLIVVASEDVGLADNTLLPLAIATHDAVMKVGLPEARINLAHCVTALALSPKSTRAYRGLNAAMASVQDPITSGLPIPLHLRNAPTRLMKEVGYGADYKYNPEYQNGRVKQDYLPQRLLGSKFLEERDLGTKTDPDLEETEAEGLGTDTDQTAEEANDIAAEAEGGAPVSHDENDLEGENALDDDVGGLELTNGRETGEGNGDDEEFWEQNESGLWAVRKSSQSQPLVD